MIKALTPSASSPLQTGRVAGVSRAEPVKAASGVNATASLQAPSPAADLAAAGPPVDRAKIDRIRAGIADGSYAPSASNIASRMVDLDLPSAK